MASVNVSKLPDGFPSGKLNLRATWRRTRVHLYSCAPGPGTGPGKGTVLAEPEEGEGDETHSPPKSCMPSSAKITMNRKSRNSSDRMLRIEFSSEITRFRSDVQ